MRKRYFQDPRLPFQVIFEPKALRAIRKHVQILPWSREGGGQMFGRIDGYRVVVSEVTEPNPKDKRTRTSFVLDVATANQQIADRFRQGLQYLGDWHTHPEARPKPSLEDRQNASRMFKTASGRPWFLMVIAGRDETWIGLHNEKSIVRLAEVK